MKIAIDLNDVLRDYTRSFAKYYKQGIDRTFDMSTIEELTTNDMFELFPFKSIEAYHKFIYEDYSWEIYGKCETCTRTLTSDFKNWLTRTILNIDTEEPIEVMIVSPMEYGLSIPSSYFFLSKLGMPVRETYFPSDSSEIWERCDVLITANPKLLAMKPENGKIAIRIEMDYNKESEYDYSYSTITEFFSNQNNTEKLLKHE